MHERYSYCKNIAHIFVILWGYDLTWYACGVRNTAPKDLGLNSLNFREGNEESSEEARAEKARVYAEFDDCPRTEKFLKLFEFRHFERHILFSQSDRKEKKKAISNGVNVQVVVRV